jgi:propionyl-CoA carboxylase beta chain
MAAGQALHRRREARHPRRPAQAEKVDEFRDRFANPYVAAERGYIDAVIRPSETRRRLNPPSTCSPPSATKNPPKKHGNIPL